MLGKSSGNGIYDTQSPYSIGYHCGSGAVHAGVTVGRVTGVQLVAISNPLDWTLKNIVKKIEVIIPWNPENVLNANLPQTMQDIAGNSVILVHKCLR
jgi:hypothetical protein